MIVESFKKLGLDEDASREEAAAAYEKLKAQYGLERFSEGGQGAAAARNLEELEIAYREVKAHFQIRDAQSKYGSVLGEIDMLIRKNNITEAQQRLDGMSGRSAEWHYLQSIIFFKRGWFSECKKQLEMALKTEPENPKYAVALSRLNGMATAGAGNFASVNPGAGTGPGAGSGQGAGPGAAGEDDAEKLKNPALNTMTESCCCPGCYFCC